MKLKRNLFNTISVLFVLIVFAIFTSGCGLIDVFVRALSRYCEAPEFVVNRFDDPARGGLCTIEDCSLRKAVTASNSCPGTQTIRIPAGTYLLSLAGSNEDANRTGDLDVTDGVTIIGTGTPVISANGLVDRIFDIFAPAHATLTSLTIADGNAVDGGGIRNAGTLTLQGGALQQNLGRRGAGLFNSGTAELDSVMIQVNQAERGFGGGIYNEGNLSFTHGTLQKNTGTVGVQGGGLFNSGTVVFSDVNVAENISELAGGGIHNTGSFAMTGGTIQKNNAGSDGAGVYNSLDGTLNLSNVTIKENILGALFDTLGVPVSGGAGLANYGLATIEGGLISHNQADPSRGGGILNYGTLSVLNTTVQSNNALQGAGLFNYGIARIDGSTFNDNTVTGFDIFAGIGGGIDNQYQANLTLTNSTLSHNVAESSSMALVGAGLYNEGVAELSNVTVTGNTPDGLYSGLPGIDGETAPVGPPALKLKNSIISGNAASDCSGATIESQGHNLDGDNTCLLTAAGDLPNLNPLLGALFPNGGATRTHALLIGSPAIDKGASCLAVDQRGISRPQPAGGVCDIGAYEYTPGNSNEPLAIPTATVIATPAPATDPLFTFSRDATCRKGPGTLYEADGYGKINQQAQIKGVSQPFGWYYVLLPDGIMRCWVAETNGTTSGQTDGLSVIPAPALPATPTATKTVAAPTPTPPAFPLAPVLNVSNQVCSSKEYIIRLSWKDVKNETGYRVYRDGVLIATLDAGATSFNDTSPDYETHGYRLDAFNASGFASSSVKNSEGCVY